MVESLIQQLYLVALVNGSAPKPMGEPYQVEWTEGWGTRWMLLRKGADSATSDPAAPPTLSPFSLRYAPDHDETNESPYGTAAYVLIVITL